MNYVRGAFSAVTNYYGTINASTLTGAIDVIVVDRPGSDGTNELVCTPFHVRFGKWQAFRPGERQVTVLVNGQAMPYPMKIGDAGEAFFVFETEEDVPRELMTSPILGPTQVEDIDARARSDHEAQRQHESAGRFGAQDDSPDGGLGLLSDLTETPGLDSDQMTEPTFLDLNNSREPSPPTTSPPSPTQSDQLEAGPPDPKGSPDKKRGLLSQTASVTKSILSAGPGVASLAKNVVLQAPETAVDQLKKLREDLDGLNPTRYTDSEGDEALEGMDREAGQPPDIRYGKDIVLDIGGYHGAVDEEAEAMEKEQGGEGEGEEEEERHIRFAEKTPKPTKLRFDPEITDALDSSELEHTFRHPDFDRTPRPSFADPQSPERPSNELRRTVSSPGQSSAYEDTRSQPSLSPTASHVLAPSSSSATIRALGIPSSSQSTFTNPHAHANYVRGESAPPDLQLSTPLPSMSTSAPEYSWEWGAFPTRSPVATRRTFFDVSDEPDAPKRSRGPSMLIRNATSMDDLDVEAQKHAAEGSVGGSGSAVDQRIAPIPSSRSDGDLSSPEVSPVLAPTTSMPMNKRASSSTWSRWWTRSRAEQASEGSTISMRTVMGTEPTTSRPELKPTISAPSDLDVLSSQPSSTMGMSYSAPASIPLPSSPTLTATPTTRTKNYAKTLRLTSDQLKALQLKKGANTITFSLSATGAVVCTAKLFLWDSTDCVVVSDIDGTITKSDALGHMFNLIGRDWTHLGVAKLYTDIARNGYKLMYLTSRAIGQADSTRDYLKGIKQNNYQLPEGPVIMSPDRLMASLHREVIMRKPEVFKMACLRDIQRLFGTMNKDPFYAGFGNRITDALSYRSVNVPSARIFTIDSSGEVKMELLELAGYKSSYIHMTDLVDQMFPPIHRKWATEYTDFNYWRDPLPDVDLPDLDVPLSPALSAVSDASGVSRLARLRHFSLRSNASSNNVAAKEAVNKVMRQASPLGPTRLAGRVANSMMDDNRSATLVDSSSDHELELRRKLSFESVPGSMPGSGSDYDGPDEEEEELEHDEDGDEEDVEEDGVEGDEEDEEEVEEEPVFDDDILATGEMENVPFL